MNNYTQQYLRAVANPLPEMQDYFTKENRVLQFLAWPNASVLDVGCGNGRTLIALAPHVTRMVGIDYDSELVAVARENTQHLMNVRVMDGDFFTVSFRKQFTLTCATYNLLGSSELERDSGKQMLLGKMLSLTKQGGHVYCAVWSDSNIAFAERYYPSIGIKVVGIESGDVHTDHGVFHRFSESELATLAQQFSCPFHIVEVGSVMYGIVIDKV